MKNLKKTPLIYVSVQGDAKKCSPDLAFPNGIVISKDLTQVTVAETVAQRLVSFKRASDGSLYDRQLLKKIEGAWPDGICLDARGCIWLAPVKNPEVLCIDSTGIVIERIATNGSPIACALGGNEEAILYVTTAPFGAPVVEGVEDFYRTKRAGFVEKISVSAGPAEYS